MFASLWHHSLSQSPLGPPRDRIKPNLSACQQPLAHQRRPTHAVSPRRCQLWRGQSYSGVDRQHMFCVRDMVPTRAIARLARPIFRRVTSHFDRAISGISSWRLRNESDAPTHMQLVRLISCTPAASSMRTPNACSTPLSPSGLPLFRRSFFAADTCMYLQSTARIRSLPIQCSLHTAVSFNLASTSFVPQVLSSLPLVEFLHPRSGTSPPMPLIGHTFCFATNCRAVVLRHLPRHNSTFAACVMPGG
ncbi:hypothetical protein BCV70DRAFT_103916 [Testicularia cyperi]|uniref:Uncharacterized protein n=1 Tax=Testicularia cyperi TaxID=1882483 RepID=A0A317XNT0_9BASI|nr:hypothetical protein BCV70DRAFT_103916 [Testicularia cyperi]